MSVYHVLLQGLEEYIEENFQGPRQISYIKDVVVGDIKWLYQSGFGDTFILSRLLSFCDICIPQKYNIVRLFVVFSFLKEDGVIFRIFSEDRNLIF